CARYMNYGSGYLYYFDYW
nr:immunoglobulin heavy chain junction region [Macaca mulatta]MOW87785.1 immunoglobulin heavy chain junction region [Macaca mulatta]MOW89036.1 immunoglobulin heavy chain junction region [Macaca mulatta]MOW90283.1 immunoglobulin heavy chain junction region [Macaca mulatta]MOW90733.1 immunoglobulin heavy chain junction region [Macaca mulatta]